MGFNLPKPLFIYILESMLQSVETEASPDCPELILIAYVIFYYLKKSNLQELQFYEEPNMLYGREIHLL